MFKLHEETKKNIYKKTGINADKMLNMGTKQIDTNIEEKIGKKLKLKHTNDHRLRSRGSVYLFLLRILKIGKINKKLAHI